MSVVFSIYITRRHIHTLKLYLQIWKLKNVYWWGATRNFYSQILFVTYIYIYFLIDKMRDKLHTSFGKKWKNLNRKKKKKNHTRSNILFRWQTIFKLISTPCTAKGAGAHTRKGGKFAPPGITAHIYTHTHVSLISIMSIFVEFSCCLLYIQ